MTIRAFYSRGGFSIQDPPIQVINNVGNYNGGTGTFSGTVTAPNFVGMVDGLDLDRYKENLQTGVLYGGIISINASDSSKIDITAGAGIICTPGASLVAMPVPVVTTVTWTAKIGVTITGIASSDETWFSISSTGTVIQHSVAWTDAQFDSEIPLGAVYHVNHSTVNLVKNYPHVAYAQAGQMDPFIRAFGPLKLSGHEISANGANLSVNRSSGRSYAIGRNYQTDPNNPNIVTDTNALPATVVWRFYRNGGTGFTTVVNSTIDPSHYDNGTGTLASNTSQWTIQRIFYLPNQPNTIGVYYGRATYPQLADAQLALLTEEFSESESTATQGIFLGYLIVKGSVTALNDSAKAKFIQGGLFRNVSGIGGSGLAVAYLDDISDVTITSAANNDLLKWNGSQWVNSTIASLAISSLGTVTTGTWNATAIADAYISSAATWNTASTDRLKWDGGATGLVAATGRTSLGLIIGTDVQAYSATLAAAAGGTYTGNVTGNISGSSGSCTGNAATATNVPYTGLTGTVPTWNQSTTGNAATATNVPYTGLTGTVPTWNQSTTGNAATVTNGAYTNINNNFSVTQTFQTDITVNGLTVGLGAGNFTENLAIGAGALGSNDSGLYNTAIGTGALSLVFDGQENSAFGTGALEVLVDGSENIAFGRSALGSLVNGNSNTAIGKSSMFDAVDATGNVAIGNALMALVSGSWNVAIGDLCLLSGECTGNVANGRSALQHITTGDNNVALGYQAGKRRGTGVSTLLSATESIFIGNTARASASAMTREIVIGSNAVGLGSETTVIGVSTTLGNRIFGVASTGQVAPTIASAGTIAPTKTITFISGTTAIATITAPSTIATTGGQITLIPTGIFTTTTAGNIALASTAVVSKALIMTYDATTTKWYPSY